MFAILKTGGKQYKVKVGDELLIERLPVRRSSGEGGESGKDKTLKLDKVLAVSKDGATEVGRPFVKGAFCEAELLGEVKTPRTVSFKYIRREKSATKIGHRQKYLKVKIKSIHLEKPVTSNQ